MPTDPTMYALPVLCIDFETTGPDPKTAKPVSCCVARFQLEPDAEPEVLLSTKVNPGCTIPPETTAIHGISDADVADAPSLDWLGEQLEALLPGAVLMAYNAPYEHGILQRWGLGGRLRDWLDPYVWAKVEDKYKSGKRLADVCERRGIPIDAHNAEGDVLATCALSMRLLRELAVPRRESLSRFLEWQRETGAEQEAELEAYLGKSIDNRWRSA